MEPKNVGNAAPRMDVKKEFRSGRPIGMLIPEST